MRTRGPPAPYDIPMPEPLPPSGFLTGKVRRLAPPGHPSGRSISMTVFRHIAAEFRTDRAFRRMILGLGSWSVLSLALNVLDLLSAS